MTSHPSWSRFARTLLVGAGLGLLLVGGAPAVAAPANAAVVQPVVASLVSGLLLVPDVEPARSVTVAYRSADSPATVTTTLTAASSVVSAEVSVVSKCVGDTYRNSDGDCVPVPRHSDGAPQGATAQCKDGTYSSSKHRRGTCSGHGGVARWL
ncbi:DUF3761 domain-containing protein [Nocardia salmonicida]|uniref:DUF3761 domain-containing protein n=1 Tax=Nocardia salmonicida TaxID=53431 RepID=UPI0033FEB12F